VAPKVQHFAWKLANDSLPIWRNKQKRNLETMDQCPICGREPEDNFHPFFGCTLAKELWNAMVEEWQIPVLSSVVNTGRDWLLNFLANQTEDIGNKVLMTLWRSWHIRNEIVHDKKPPLLFVSKRFLISYMESILMIKYHTRTEDISKGKFILGSGGAREKDKQVITGPRWVPPPDGWEKLNTDGSFGPNGDAGAGILVHDHQCEIILSSYRKLLACKDPLGAELYALKEGISLALHWCNKPLIIETDCLEMVSMIKNSDTDRSAHAMVIEEIKALLKVRQACITHVKRCQNNSSHYLANYARTSSRTAIWLASSPEGLSSICQRDVISDI
jgi:hypothetical protein